MCMFRVNLLVFDMFIQDLLLSSATAQMFHRICYVFYVCLFVCLNMSSSTFVLNISTFQFHCKFKAKFRPSISAFNHTLHLRLYENNKTLINANRLP